MNIHKDFKTKDSGRHVVRLTAATYRCLENIHKDFKNRDSGRHVIRSTAANGYMSYSKFLTVLNSGAADKKHLLVWLADYIRFLACKGSSACNATFLDADVIWFRALHFGVFI